MAANQSVVGFNNKALSLLLGGGVTQCVHMMWVGDEGNGAGVSLDVCW